MIRVAGTALALTAHVMLGITIWFLFPFLMGGRLPVPEEASGWWAWDALLVLQFGAAHSILLLPAMRARVERILPGPLYGCLFTLTTCLSLLLLVLAWRTSPVVLWQLEGWTAMAMYAGYMLSWVGLFYSLSLTG